MKIASICDGFTSFCLDETVQLKPYFMDWQIHRCKPSLLFVESAWQGNKSTWKYKIASYPNYSNRNNNCLVRLIETCQKRHIPTIFWDKEGLIHFDRFIDSAQLFDHIFTVDAEAVPKYRSRIGAHASIHVLPFPVNLAIHYFDGFLFDKNCACFVGSYNSCIHERRRYWQNMMFRSACCANLNCIVYDRNSRRKNAIYRYPSLNGLTVFPEIPYSMTASIYKKYVASLNVNTPEHSSTMVSRRLVEIIACGGIAVTNPNPAVEKEYKDYCHVVHNEEETIELLARLKYGPSREDMERARAGAMYIAENHNWEKALRFICDVAGVSFPK